MNEENKVFCFKNLDKVENIDEVYDSKKDAFICDDITIPMYKVPSIDNNVYYMDKGTKEYFKYQDYSSSLEWEMVMEEKIENGVLNIKNLWLRLSAFPLSYLGIFLNDDINNINNLLRYKINYIFSLLPFSEKELKMYEEMIKKYIFDVMNAKINTMKIIEQIKEKAEKESEIEDLENKPFVSGEENWYKGKCYKRIKDLVKEFGISHGTLWNRMKAGMSIREMIETPKGIRAKRK